MRQPDAALVIRRRYEDAFAPLGRRAQRQFTICSGPRHRALRCRFIPIGGSRIKRELSNTMMAVGVDCREPPVVVAAQR